MTTRKTPALRLLRSGLLALGLVAVTGGSFVAPAFADDWRHGRDERFQERRDHERFRNVRHDFRDDAPRYGYRYVARRYAYPPAPVYGYAAPSLSFDFSFR